MTTTYDEPCSPGEMLTNIALFISVIIAWFIGKPPED
jgi:hypothetical protein